jgi:DNA invertase Pin-like site-specific DNA recombinase
VVIIYAPRSSLADNALLEYAAQRGWTETRVISDSELLMRAVQGGQVGILLCSTLKGLGRNSSHFGEVLRSLVSRRVVLIVPAQGIDTSKVPGEVILGLLDDIDEFKRSVAQERTNAGLAAAKARGVKLGRPRTLGAYHGDVARLRAQGLSGRAVARKLGLPVGSVFGILRHLSDNSASSTPRRNIEVIKK